MARAPLWRGPTRRSLWLVWCLIQSHYCSIQSHYRFKSCGFGALSILNERPSTGKCSAVERSQIELNGPAPRAFWRHNVTPITAPYDAIGKNTQTRGSDVLGTGMDNITMLFLCLALGMALRKLGQVPDNAHVTINLSSSRSRSPRSFFSKSTTSSSTRR
jgi:hypothetical protein